MTESHKQTDIRTLLKQMSPQDFRKIGIHEVAYVRPMPYGTNGEVFAVYAADGTRLSVFETIDHALATLQNSDLVPVTLH